MSPWTFAVAIVLGRGFRYVGEGLLAVWYGERALAFLEANGRQIALWTGLAVLAAGAAYSGGDRGGPSSWPRCRRRDPRRPATLRDVVDALAGRDLGLDVRGLPTQLERHQRGSTLERRASGMPGHAGLGAAEQASASVTAISSRIA